MKHTLMAAITIFISLSAILYAENADGNANVDKKAEELAKLILSIPQYIDPQPGNPNKWFETAIPEFAEKNGIPKAVYVKIFEHVIDEDLAYFEKEAAKNNNLGFYGDRGARAAGNIILMGKIGDPAFLPYLEKMSESFRMGTRTQASIAYVKIAGLDAVPFVRKILSEKDEKYDFHCKYLATKEFFEQIAKAESEKAPQKKIDAAYKMLVEQAQTVAYVGHADEIDKFLCERLQGYRASIQREKIVERFVDSENEIARANFGKKRDEIQKTPKAERTDLSNRFPGLAEVKLEDEKQTETTKPEEDK